VSFLFTNGEANNLSFTETLVRSSVDQPIYPRSGSEFSASVQLTPPYSLFSNKDYSSPSITPQEKYRWVEYHKWKFKATWYTAISSNRKLVLATKARFGFLGEYNSAIGQSPFERFYLGGDGLTGYAQFDGREIIALRGYQNNTLTPRNLSGNFIGGSVYDKYVLELRYPISLNPSATIYALTFAEAGNTWLNFSQFSPFEAKRSIGGGLRIFLPALGGLLGIDYGYGLDNIPDLPAANHGQFHFSIGASMD
jgi:outer membrane protein insertion porin family